MQKKERPPLLLDIIAVTGPDCLGYPTLNINCTQKITGINPVQTCNFCNKLFSSTKEGIRRAIKLSSRLRSSNKSEVALHSVPSSTR